LAVTDARAVDDEVVREQGRAGAYGAQSYEAGRAVDVARSTFVRWAAATRTSLLRDDLVNRRRARRLPPTQRERSLFVGLPVLRRPASQADVSFG